MSSMCLLKRKRTMSWIFFIVTMSSFLTLTWCKVTEEEPEDPHRDPSMCEVCKYLTTELKERLMETGKTKEVLETGYSIDKKKTTKKYRDSELRLIEAVYDPHVCGRMKDYQVHAERKGSLRFAKGRSQTMETLHNLVDKGVQVELGIPYELWDSPSAGVTEMERKCYKIVEDHEEAIEEWYFNHQQEDLTTYLCRDQVLAKDDTACLREKWLSKKVKEGEREEEKGEGSKPQPHTPPKSQKAKKAKSKSKGETGDPKDEL